MRYLPTLDNLFDDIFDSDFLTPTRTINNMRTDIKEVDGQYQLAIELPGYDKDQIHVELKDGYLNVSADASKTNEDKDDKGNIIRSERYHGTCSRSFYVGENYKPEDINAKLDNGELLICLPKETPEQVEENHFIAIE
ncbi:Hsp20/alpha crystallin family protein [Sharpea azabuensis]|uniref:Hsp20/alpha crystallin family protein n=1 Tax=Sharpea azabuensis TaxID=322505 RepID=UPI003D04B819